MKIQILAAVLAVEAILLSTGCGVTAAPEPEQIEQPITLASIDEMLGQYCPSLKDKHRENLHSAVATASEKFNVHQRLILAVVTVESRCKHKAKSPVGARGAMQLMPNTARWLGVRNSYSIRENVHGGTKYLAHLLDEFDYDLELALAAYNAGPTSVRRFGGIPPYAETEQFVSRVLETYYDYLAAV